MYSNLEAMILAAEAIEMHIHGSGSIIHSKIAFDALNECIKREEALNELVKTSQELGGVRMTGKGSTPRPLSVPRHAFEDSFEIIFGVTCKRCGKSGLRPNDAHTCTKKNESNVPDK